MANKKQVEVASAMIDNPRISSVSAEKLPAIKNWKVDENYKLEVSVTMQGIRKDEYDNNKLKADFKINSIKEIK